jgi:hypothetical protein
MTHHPNDPDAQRLAWAAVAFVAVMVALLALRDLL